MANNNMSTRKTAPRRKKQYFSVEQANRMLPLVKAITRDIVELAADLQERQQRLLRIRPSKKVKLEPAHQEEIQQMELELSRGAARVEELTDELRELGVEFKGWDGLVDFPSLMDGREVYLCWKLGEPEVAHWHELDAGFSGRQKLYADAGVGEGEDMGSDLSSL
jgi:hypothetical protein